MKTAIIITTLISMLYSAFAEDLSQATVANSHVTINK